MPPRMLTINAAAAETGLSAHFVRQLCLQKKIVHVRAGQKYLINVGKLIDFLNTGDTQPEPTRGMIRPVATHPGERVS